MGHIHRGAPPRRLDADRFPSGRINHRRSAKASEEAVPYYAYARRLRLIDPERAALLMAAARTPARKLHKLHRGALMDAVRAAQDPRLGYALGVLWASGLLCPMGGGEESEAAAAEREEHATLLERAGRIYAAQHFLVWRGRGSPNMALPSHLERIVDEVFGDTFRGPAPTAEEAEKLEADRLALERQLAGARRALMQAAPMGLALKAVDRICLDGFEDEVHPGPLNALRRGLQTLVAYYDVRMPPKRDRDRALARPRAEMADPKIPDCPDAARPRRRPSRNRMPVYFTPEAMPQAPPEAVQRSIAALMSRSTKESTSDGARRSTRDPQQDTGAAPDAGDDPG